MNSSFSQQFVAEREASKTEIEDNFRFLARYGMFAISITELFRIISG